MNPLYINKFDVIGKVTFVTNLRQIDLMQNHIFFLIFHQNIFLKFEIFKIKNKTNGLKLSF